MEFSVIIPTYNSAATLAPLLHDLASQWLPAREIIVADGGSADATVQIARDAGVQVVDNPQRHAAGGRNCGARVARGEWLAFTDSDCRVGPEWLDTAARTLAEHNDLVGLAGRMRATPPRNAIERVAGDAFLHGVMQFSDERSFARHRGVRGAFITANVFYRRDAFTAIGGFDEWFATQAEDIDLFWRMLARFPGQLLYEPALEVRHCFPTSWRSLYRKWFSYGIASCRLQKRHLRAIHFDGAHYRRLALALASLVRHPERKTENMAQIVQLAGHLAGKASGSVRFGIINL